MKTSRYILLAALLISTVASVSAVPEIPHHVYGDITDTDGPVNDINVSFYHDGSVVSSTLTDSTGYYDIKIPYDSNYDGETLDVYTEDINTGKDIIFSNGSSERINYEGRNIIRESFAISGTVTKDSNAVDGTSVEFYNDGSSIVSTTTNSNGDYSVDISFSDNYDGEKLTLHVNNTDTGKNTTFVTDSSDTLDYTISTDSTDSTTDETTDSTTDETTDSSTSSGTTDDTTDDSNVSDVDSSTGDDTDNPDETEGSAVVEVTDISSSPQDPKTNETVEFYVTVTNTGDATTDHEVSITIGSEQLTKTINDLSPGDTEVAIFEKKFDSEETYSVSAGDQSYSVDVSGSQNEETEDGGLSFIQIMGLIGGLLMVIVVVYLFADSRGSKKDMNEEQKGALDAYKEEKKESEGDEDGFGWKYADED